LHSIPLSQNAQAKQLLCAYAEGSIRVAEIDMQSLSNPKMRDYLVSLDPSFGFMFDANNRMLGYKPRTSDLCHLSAKSFEDFWKRFKEFASS
jgi:hypothetical protein